MFDAEHLQLGRDLRPWVGGGAAHAERGSGDADDGKGDRAPDHVTATAARRVLPPGRSPGRMTLGRIRLRAGVRVSAGPCARLAAP